MTSHWLPAPDSVNAFPSMSTTKKAKDSPIAEPTAREIVSKLAAAQKKASATRKAAESAKADFKRAKKTHKLAKKAAKVARKAVKGLKKALVAARAAARRKAAAKARGRTRPKKTAPAFAVVALEPAPTPEAPASPAAEVVESVNVLTPEASPPQDQPGT